ncbi:23S rRNA methyltransferase [Paraglaciecola arctica BSs20135]|uniref:23S rRNA methyltransferase n=2 Tax=Paraglaciecola TaxID=1621534 RepID=K6XIF8_9ALTE|nr:RNA methyltransferase [Paraglaciecola arctica]GAC20434.1 23S rRNA methyltransferase [Paraglaciecola arctica BSs20135]
MPTHIAIINPKSPQNMGSILRAAGCYQAQSIRYTGERYARAKAFSTDTKNAYLKISVTHVDTVIDPIKDKHLTKVAVELVEGATPLPLFEHPEQALYIFGPEDGSIEQDVVDQCDHVVYIPTVGCMNLAATVNVLLYDRMAKTAVMPLGDEVIKNSRDTNNRTKAK